MPLNLKSTGNSTPLTLGLKSWGDFFGPQTKTSGFFQRFAPVKYSVKHRGDKALHPPLRCTDIACAKAKTSPTDRNSPFCLHNCCPRTICWYAYMGSLSWLSIWAHELSLLNIARGKERMFADGFEILISLKHTRGDERVFAVVSFISAICTSDVLNNSEIFRVNDCWCLFSKHPRLLAAWLSAKQGKLCIVFAHNFGIRSKCSAPHQILTSYITRMNLDTWVQLFSSLLCRTNPVQCRPPRFSSTS